MEIIQATVLHAVYKNEETGFAVLEMESEQTEDFTAVGSLALAMDGERLELSGEWTVHPGYGRQFKVEAYQTMLPTTRDGMIRYLSSNAVYGIGKAMAKRIVDQFGDDTMDIINFQTDRLLEIEGIGPKKLEKIVESLQKNQGMREVMIFMQTYGITALLATKIYNKFGRMAINVVKEDPYVLAEEIDGIGFLTADRVARAMGISADSPQRVNASVQYALKQASAEGHTYLPKEELIQRVKKITGVSDDLAQNAIIGLALKDKIVMLEEDGKSFVYYEAFYYAERYIAGKLKLMVAGSITPKAEDNKTVSDCIRAYEKSHGIKLHTEQISAIEMASREPVSIITGGPGTGKTTIIKCLIDIFEKSGKSVFLAAPTGRAAKRMAQTTERTAQTIHRMLEYDFTGEDKYTFSRNDANPLECDVLVIDEMSMVDTLLMFYVVKATSSLTRIILVGDEDQLPSVGPGNVLHDLLVSEQIPFTRLVEIYRQDNDSTIVTNAHRINHGQMPIISSGKGDFFLMKRTNPQQIVDTLVDTVVRRLNDYYGFEPLRDIQVLSPARKGVAGVNNLNKVLQASLNPPSRDKAEYAFRESVFREGDRVMQIKNNYTIEWETDDTHGVGVFNGDMGFIKAIDNTDEFMLIELDDGKFIEYKFAWLDELELAYAATVHKSQGNQFPVVVMPLAGGSNMLFSRSLLYTGITRAEKLVILIGREDILSYMVDNDYKSVRYTGLWNMFGDDNTQTQIVDDVPIEDTDDTRNDISTDDVNMIDWNDIFDF